MANIALFLSGKVPQYLISVNTSDYVTDPDALINPDISVVLLVPIKYWKRVADTITEMSSEEKAAIDAANLTTRKNLADNYAVDLKPIFTALVKVINIRLPAGQKITESELITAIKAEII